MYKVLIVDDEILSRVGIKSLIPWEAHGFEIVGEAENGKKALEMIRKLRPDIVLTDIKMPVIDGIELVRIAQKEHMSCKFIVLSSYDDFQYVKEVMKNGAEDYIIKLEMQPDQLLDILNKLKEQIRSEDQVKKESFEQERRQHTNAPVIREKLFKDMVYGLIYDREEIVKSLQFLNIYLPEGQFVCLVIQVDNLEIHQKYGEKDIHVLDFAMMNVVEEIIHNYKWGYVFRTKPKELVIIYSYEKDEILRLTGQINGALKQYLNLSVSIGVSRIQALYEDIKLSYDQAVIAVNKRFTYPRGCTILYEEIAEVTDIKESIDFSREIKALEKSLEICDWDEMNLSFSKIIRKLSGSNHQSKAILKGYCSTIVFVVSTKMEDAGMESDDLWKENPYLQIENLTVISDFIQWLEQFQKRVFGFLQETDECKRIIVQAKQFISKHYKEDISLETVGEYLNISQKYLSNLFKKETGDNFIDYVTGIRIQHAKELLKHSDYKVYEIGQMVGYENEHYFSRVFKKVTGMSPVKYKN